MVADGKRTDLLGAGLLGLAAIQFGTVVVVGKVSTTIGLSTFWVLAVRFAIAALLLAIVLALLRQPLVAARGERIGLLLLGAIGYGVEATFFFLALDHGNASIVTLLFFTYPAIVSLAWMAMGRGSPGWLLGGALVAAISGAALVVASSGGLTIEPLGVVFALSAAVTFSGYLIGADHVLRRTGPLTSSMWVSGSAALGLAVWSLAGGDVTLLRGLDQWGPVAWIGVATAGAFVSLLAGLRILGPVRTAIIGATEPLAAAILAFVFLEERVTPLVAVGGALILAGAVAASLARRPETMPASRDVPFEPPAP
ncbi:MAG: EamA family transporter [Actinobacteria bacterium]|nr:EamA family transporter [Actinomycetota bacterium]